MRAGVEVAAVVRRACTGHTSDNAHATGWHGTGRGRQSCSDSGRKRPAAVMATLRDAKLVLRSAAVTVCFGDPRVWLRKVLKHHKRHPLPQKQFRRALLSGRGRRKRCCSHISLPLPRLGTTYESLLLSNLPTLDVHT